MIYDKQDKSRVLSSYEQARRFSRTQYNLVMCS